MYQINGKSDNTKDIALTVSIKGNNSVTIKDLPIGDYTVTELTSWSWRYDSYNPIQDVILTSDHTKNLVIFEQNRVNEKWFDGNAQNTNIFTRE